MKDRTGQHIDNRYRLLRWIGGGNFGNVYLAEDTLRGNKQVAIKILQDRDGIEGFINEIRVTLLRHPNIVPIIGFNKDHLTGALFLVMEYMPHGTLRQRHPRGTRLPLSTIISYVKQIAAALDYAHGEGLVHRDVKPENILIGSNNTILLSDFGVATTSSTVNPSLNQEAVGTWHYIAPEQLQREPVRESDQYALAIIVYEWLLGAPPFRGRTWQELGYQQVHTAPASLREQGIPISQEVEDVIFRALAKDPKQRFASVGSFADALEHASRPAPGTVHATFRMHTDTITALSWSPDSTRIVSADASGVIHVWEAVNGNHCHQYRGHTCRVENVAWSPDGQWITSADENGMLHIWHAHTGDTRSASRGCRGTILGLAWSPDSQYLATADSKKAVHIWQATTGQHVRAYYDHASDVECVAWSPDGKYLASGSYDMTIQVRAAMTGEKICTYHHHHGGIYTLSWLSNDAQIASGSFDGTVHVWNAHTGQTALIYSRHTGGVFSLSPSPQQPFIASGGDDRTIQIWDARTGTTLFTFAGEAAGIRAVAWSPDGLSIASGGLGTTVFVWQAP